MTASIFDRFPRRASTDSALPAGMTAAEVREYLHAEMAAHRKAMNPTAKARLRTQAATLSLPQMRASLRFLIDRDAALAASVLGDAIAAHPPGPSRFTWRPIQGTGYPDQQAEVAWPFHAQVGPEDSTAGTWSWTLLRANLDGTTTELTGSGKSAPAASEDLAKLLAEAAGLGALAQYETAETETA